MTRQLSFFLLFISILTACQRTGDPEPVVVIITRINPGFGLAGSVINLHGRGFQSLTNPTVFFGTASSTALVLADSVLQTSVPASLSVDTVVPVSVQSSSQTATSPTNFTVGSPIVFRDPDVITIAGSLTSNTTWTAGNRYRLSGTVIVRAGATLTIRPGTVIMGDYQTRGMLLVEPGGKLIADGTADKPIVFTSAQPPGSREAGDWGGIIIIGNAPTNSPNTMASAFVSNQSSAQPTGNQAADNSGTLRYVRIEYTGRAYPTDILYGLRLVGVGSNTVIDHVQVSFSLTDSFQIFGGTVNARHLISYQCTDDDIDVNLGYTGRIQYVLALRDPIRADPSGSNGIESGNDAAGSNNRPLTAAVVSNLTFIGPNDRGTQAINNNNQFGIHQRRNSRASVHNSAFAGCYVTGLLVQGDSAIQGFNKTYFIENNTFSPITTKSLNLTTPLGNILTYAVPVTSAEYYRLPPAEQVTLFNAANRTMPVADLKLDNLLPITRITNPGVLPGAGSVLLTGAAFPANSLVSNAFFDRVNYIGAFGSNDWTQGWANFNPQVTVY